MFYVKNLVNTTIMVLLAAAILAFAPEEVQRYVLPICGFVGILVHTLWQPLRFYHNLTLKEAKVKFPSLYVMYWTGYIFSIVILALMSLIIYQNG
ncbi:hypothetical protein D1224_14975 [Henriciella barbarensis]|uniref:Uncharacterized protein n=1 Tax=Henriciella barbarensis TaxID=86342 RepID=A0A399QQH2_9PROT|nr:hypothetical protein [Henriciella barbarensis]RIJ20425.1 hypothetical protein D1224_14975 [Henriciella barbarensis]